MRSEGSTKTQEKLKDLGEFGLIDRIARFLPSPPPDVIVGIGDDVAVMRTSSREYLLATCDIQVENVHFRRKDTSPRQLGRRAAAINLSDIAAKGGLPSWALVSLALPPDLEPAFVDELYAGMLEEMERAGAAIVGGNLSRASGAMVIDLFLLGRVDPGELVLRQGAREGDLVLVTGTLGDSRAGLELLRRPELGVAESARCRVWERHRTPIPRLAEGRALACSGMVHAMVDVSDGLASDLGHICRASRVGAEIRMLDLPVSAECEETARAAGYHPLQWALAGGEDYELLFTVAAGDADAVRKILADATGMEARVIGRILPESSGILIKRPSGEGLPTNRLDTGWDHFSPV